MEQATTGAERRARTRPGNPQIGVTARRDRRGRRRTPAARRIVRAGVVIALAVVLSGCGPRQQQSDMGMADFDGAGPVRFNVDCKQVLQIRMPPGPYRLVPGDLLELQMPTIVGLLPDRNGDDTVPYRCRVDSAGRVVLPITGNLAVAGKTLTEVEAVVAKLYHPKYVLQEPSIVASVGEYRLSSVSVVGAVRAPGIYELRSNEMALISVLMKAGGIADNGATSIHVSRSNAGGAKPVTVAVLDMNIPTRDVKLADGDAVIVEGMEPQAVTVVGLVKSPGTFPWNPRGRCTVMDAIAYAGGVNDLADPQYARVYRQDTGGQIVSAVVGLDGPTAVGASKLTLKPGDIVAVEQTARTRTRLFLAQIIHMGFGVNAGVGP